MVVTDYVGDIFEILVTDSVYNDTNIIIWLRCNPNKSKICADFSAYTDLLINIFESV